MRTSGVGLAGFFGRNRRFSGARSRDRCPRDRLRGGGRGGRGTVVESPEGRNQARWLESVHAADGHRPVDFLCLLSAMCGNTGNHPARNEYLALAGICLGLHDNYWLRWSAAGVSDWQRLEVISQQVGHIVFEPADTRHTEHSGQHTLTRLRL